MIFVKASILFILFCGLSYCFHLFGEIAMDTNYYMNGDITWYYFSNKIISYFGIIVPIYMTCYFVSYYLFKNYNLD